MPSSSGASAALSRLQLPSSLRGAKPAGGGGLYRTQLPAKRLRLSRSRPPRPESSHLSGGGGWGAARPCSGSSCFFHHSKDARAGIAGSARRSAASYWPGRTLHTQQSAKETESAALPSRPAPPPRSPAAPAASGQRGIGAEGAPAAAVRKQRPGGCCYPTPPTRSGCNALGPASARLLPACSGLVRAAVRPCGSSPSPRCPPPPPVPCPPPSQSRAPAAAAASGTGDAGLDSPRRRSGSHLHDRGRSSPSQSAWSRKRAAERSGARGSEKLGVSLRLPGLGARFCFQKELVIKLG